jgi:phosphoglycerol transferase
LKKISKSSQPFNLQIISIDNHFRDGFVGYYTLDKYKTQYENVYATDSKLIYDFISWIKKQDFYKDTTILVVGDHISMQTDYFISRGIKDRYVYSCLINSGIDAKKVNNRAYSALDTYPTLIAAIGGQIKGDRLGLGVNMLSSKETLSEQYGFALVNKELKKKSDFYNKKILADDYDKMIEDSKE